MAVSLANGDVIATGRVQGAKVKAPSAVDFEVGQTTLDALLAAKYTKPPDGIPASDIANGVIPEVSGLATQAELRYDLYTVPTTGADAYKLRARATNYLVYDSSEESYTFDLSANRPPDVQGKMTDYFIELHTDAPVTVTTNAADTAKIRGDSPSVGAAGDYWITVTTKADGNIYIRNLKMEAPQA